jgi:hypothetical protein
MTTAQYLERVLAAYEDEVAGAAYFDALAAAYSRQAAFLARCAALERATASRLNALIGKYRMKPQPQVVLEERGALEARRESGRDWGELMRRSVASYARYVDEFRALEALGPADDQPVLAALTAHEVKLIEWMRAQIAS